MEEQEGQRYPLSGDRVGRELVTTVVRVRRAEVSSTLLFIRITTFLRSISLRTYSSYYENTSRWRISYEFIRARF